MEKDSIVVVTTNYLLSIGLFTKFVRLEIYAINTMRTNWVGFLIELENLR